MGYGYRRPYLFDWSTIQELFTKYYPYDDVGVFKSDFDYGGTNTVIGLEVPVDDENEDRASIMTRVWKMLEEEFGIVEGDDVLIDLEY